MDLANTQRRFAVMGDNTFKIANKIMQNQRICRLLKYQTRDPFKEECNGKPQPDVDGAELVNKQILIVPKIFDDSTEKCHILLLFLMTLLLIKLILNLKFLLFVLI